MKLIVVSTHLFFIFLLITEDLNKKNVEHFFADIIKYKTSAKFQQKILNSMIVGAHECFQFFRQKTWFLGNDRPFDLMQVSYFAYPD